jgi:hypothetical protein
MKNRTCYHFICAAVMLASVFASVNAVATDKNAPLNRSTASASSTAAESKKSEQEYYELRTYRIENAEKQKIVSTYLENALLPALGRINIDRVGVFTLMDKKDDHSIFVLIPYPSMKTVTDLSNTLAIDKAYQKAAKDYFSQPLKSPAYKRIESRFMKAFAGMPTIEIPAQTKAKKQRMFELRTYESHNEDAAYRKVDMFNSGEIQVMRDVKLGPVFFGEMIIGDNVPNLTYMLSADNMDAYKSHWKDFLSHPEWSRMKKIEKYKGTVSKITKWYLVPTAYSQL